MKLKIKTAPTVEPISLTEAKLHLRLAVDESDAVDYFYEDNLLKRLITAAREQAEFLTSRALITQTWYGYLDEWPTGSYILVPKPVLQSATISYKMRDESTDSFTGFDADTSAEWGRLVLKPDEYWPADSLYTSNPITVEFICGYGATAASVPEGIKSAMLLMITDMYEHRGEILVGVTSQRISRAIDGLLDQYVVGRPYG